MSDILKLASIAHFKILLNMTEHPVILELTDAKHLHHVTIPIADSFEVTASILKKRFDNNPRNGCYPSGHMKYTCVAIKELGALDH